MERKFLIHFPILFLFPVILTAQTTAKEWYNKGMQLKDKQDYPGALTAFKNAIAKKGDYREACYQAAWCCNEMEKHEDAVNFLQRYDPVAADHQRDKYNELGLSYFKLQKADEAIEQYNKTLRHFPRNGVALRGLGNVYYELKDDHDKALEYFERAMEADPEESKPIYYKLAWLYNDQERYDDAIKILLKAIEYDSEDSGYREELGYAYYMRDQYEFAITQLNKAISIDENSKLGYYYKGLCLIATNKKGEAMSVYYKLKEMGNDEAGELLEKINKMK